MSRSNGCRLLADEQVAGARASTKATTSSNRPMSSDAMPS